MDKAAAKAVFAAAGLPVAESLLVGRDAVAAGHPMDPPYVVKPVNEGSSVGVLIAPEGANAPVTPAADAPETLMVERFVPGRELTVAVLGDRPLAVTDIVAATGWYDYHAKYAAGGSRHVVPADIPAAVETACLDIALAAHRALGCRGLTRADFRWDDRKGAEGVVLLEVNTQPGMTPTSLAPEQAAHVGMDFRALCSWIVEDASCGR
jgi:D-alanine-D-alanine ligase